jgi:hypothetical protein
LLLIFIYLFSFLYLLVLQPCSFFIYNIFLHLIIIKKNALLLVYEWFKSLWFFNGYDSNIAKLVNLGKYNLYKMKSHHCHVFMQTLIPITYRDLLPKGIWDAFMEICYIFRCTFQTNLYLTHEATWKKHHWDNLKTWNDFLSLFLQLNRASPHSFSVWDKS